MPVLMEARGAVDVEPYALQLHANIVDGLSAALKEIQRLESEGFVLERRFEQPGVMVRWSFVWPEEHEEDWDKTAVVTVVDTSGQLPALAGRLHL